MGEDIFYPVNERAFANRSRVNFIEFSEGENGISDKVIITIRKDKKIASRIMLDAQILESRLPKYMGSYYSDIFSIVYTFGIENGRLVINHRRYGDMRMEPIDTDDFFSSRDS